MKKILIVDDDSLIRDSIAEGLVRAGYQTQNAGDGRAALSLAGAGPWTGALNSGSGWHLCGGAAMGRYRRPDPI